MARKRSDLFRLKFRELTAGKTQQQVADELEVSQSTASNLAAGYPPSREILERMIRRWRLDRSEWLALSGYADEPQPARRFQWEEARLEDPDPSKSPAEVLEIYRRTGLPVGSDVAYLGERDGHPIYAFKGVAEALIQRVAEETATKVDQLLDARKALQLLAGHESRVRRETAESLRFLKQRVKDEDEAERAGQRPKSPSYARALAALHELLIGLLEREAPYEEWPDIRISPEEAAKDLVQRFKEAAGLTEHGDWLRQDRKLRRTRGAKPRHFINVKRRGFDLPPFGATRESGR